MKKWILISAVVVLAVSFSGVSFARDKAERRDHQGMSDAMEGEIGGCMCPMHKMMMRQMMGREIIATYDGGIAVTLGNKIAKYDKDMNLVKEIEIKMDMEAVKKSMEEMKNCCPMCSKMQDKK